MTAALICSLITFSRVLSLLWKRFGLSSRNTLPLVWVLHRATWINGVTITIAQVYSSSNLTHHALVSPIKLQS